MADAQSPLAPTPQFPERAPTEFQRRVLRHRSVTKDRFASKRVGN